MSLRSTALRLGISTTLGALCLAGAAIPSYAQPSAQTSVQLLPADPGNNPPPSYLGRISARNGLLLRDAPTRGSRIVRTEPYGAIVHIFCKTRGENVQGNDRWYQLTDGTWAWGAAYYIDNIGPAPRWC